LGLRRDDGKTLAIEVGDLTDIVNLFNYTLWERKDVRRFFNLESEAEWYAYFLQPIEKAIRLFELGALPLLSIDEDTSPQQPDIDFVDSWPPL
jgi:hypothetical protein